MNRTFNPDADKYSLKNERFNAETFIDDDLFGYMDAKRAKTTKMQPPNDGDHLKAVRLASILTGVILPWLQGWRENKTSIHSTEVQPLTSTRSPSPQKASKARTGSSRT